MTEANGGYDVVVAGGGNAALCAAIAAREAGASVLLLEKGPRAARGGNSYFTGGAVRFPYRGLDDLVPLVGEMSPQEREQVDVGSYTEAQYYDDLMRVTGGKADPDLAQALVSQAYPTALWMRRHGVRWALMYSRQAFKVDGIHRFWGGLVCETVGAGKGLVDSLYARAEGLGVQIEYETMAERLLTDGAGAVTGVATRTVDGRGQAAARSVVLACGGFESSAEMRARYLGPGWDLAKVRGTRYNTGDGLRMGMEAGAQTQGHFSGCHAVAWDAGAPEYGDLRVADLFQKHSYPLGIVVNSDGERFVDEGADFRNYTYARYGREIMRQRGRLAFQIFDQQTAGMLRDEYSIREVTSATGSTMRELAGALDIDPDGLERTVEGYNAAAQEGRFDPSVLDGKRTRGISPPKSNWALRLEKPPFVGYAVTCGITFTFGGLKIDREARVTGPLGRPIPGLYAAGEAAGGLYYDNYPGGSGLMSGAVFGRVAGGNAARLAMGE